MSSGVNRHLHLTCPKLKSYSSPQVVIYIFNQISGEWQSCSFWNQTMWVWILGPPFTVWAWATYSISPCLSFLNCKTVISAVPTYKVGRLEWVHRYKVLEAVHNKCYEHCHHDMITGTKVIISMKPRKILLSPSHSSPYPSGTGHCCSKCFFLPRPLLSSLLSWTHLSTTTSSLLFCD